MSTAVHPAVTVCNHPLVEHNLSILRDKNTSTEQFRATMSRVGKFIFMEATADLPTTRTIVETPLTKAECRRLAEAAHAGLSRVMRPSHLPSDGDISFAFTVGTAPEVPLPALLAAAQEAVAAAALAAVRR